MISNKPSDSKSSCLQFFGVIFGSFIVGSVMTPNFFWHFFCSVKKTKQNKTHSPLTVPSTACGLSLHFSWIQNTLLYWIAFLLCHTKLWFEDIQISKVDAICSSKGLRGNC